MANRERKPNIFQRFLRAVGNFFFWLSGEKKTREEERAEFQDKIEELSEELKKAKEERDKFEAIAHYLDKEKLKVENEALRKENELLKKHNEELNKVISEVRQQERKIVMQEFVIKMLKKKNKKLKRIIEEYKKKEETKKETKEETKEEKREEKKQFPENPCEYGDLETLLNDVFDKIIRDAGFSEKLVNLVFFFERTSEDQKEIIGEFFDMIIKELEGLGFKTDKLRIFKDDFKNAVFDELYKKYYRNIRTMLNISSDGMDEYKVIAQYFNSWENFVEKMKEAFISQFFRKVCGKTKTK